MPSSRSRIGCTVGALRTHRLLLRRARRIEAPPLVKATKQCVVCGTEFKAKPSGPITCGAKCARYRSGSVNRGKGVVWTEEAKRRRKARGFTPNLQLGAASVSLSPLTGPFETNIRAKIWWVVHLPSERRWPAVRNLAKWCRDNAELFAPDPWENAYAGLLAVQRWLTGKTRCRVSRWKDWTLLREGEKP